MNASRIATRALVAASIFASVVVATIAVYELVRSDVLNDRDPVNNVAPRDDGYGTFWKYKDVDGYIVSRGSDIPDLPPDLPNMDMWTHCVIVVTNTAKDTPAINRRVRVYWQWTKDKDTQPSDNGWSYTNMTCVSIKPDTVYGFPDEGEYEAWIPPQKPGYMWYYYECAYDGYWWSGKMKNTDPVVNDDPGPSYLGDDVSTHARPGTEGMTPGSVKVHTYKTRFTQVKVPIEE